MKHRKWMEFFLVSKWHVFAFKLKGEDWSNPWRAFHWNSGKPGSTSASASCFVCFFLEKKKKYSLFFNSSVSPDQHLFLDNWVGSTPCVHTILSIFKPSSRWNIYLRIRPHIGVNTEIAHEGRSNGMHGFSPYSTQTFYVIMDRNWALVYKGTVPWLFSTTRDVHIVHLLSWMVGMIWGEPNVSPDRETPAWTRSLGHSSGPLARIQLAEGCTLKFWAQTQSGSSAPAQQGQQSCSRRCHYGAACNQTTVCWPHGNKSAKWISG